MNTQTQNLWAADMLHGIIEALLPAAGTPAMLGIAVQEAKQLGAFAPKCFLSLHTPQGKILFVSPSVTEVLGYAPHEMINRSAYYFMHPEDLIKALRTHARLTLKPETRSIRLRLKHQKGAFVEMICTGRVLDISLPLSRQVLVCLTTPIA